MTVNKFRQSPKRQNIVKPKGVNRNSNYGPAFRSNSYSMRRPQTKQRESRKSTLNSTFIPYYENRVYESNTKSALLAREMNNSKRLSKPKTVQEWRRKKLKQTKKVCKAVECIELCVQY